MHKKLEPDWHNCRSNSDFFCCLRANIDIKTCLENQTAWPGCSSPAYWVYTKNFGGVALLSIESDVQKDNVTAECPKFETFRSHRSRLKSWLNQATTRWILPKTQTLYQLENHIEWIGQTSVFRKLPSLDYWNNFHSGRYHWTRPSAFGSDFDIFHRHSFLFATESSDRKLELHRLWLCIRDFFIENIAKGGSILRRSE